MTLTSLFGQAGWRTVFDVPADTEDWPEGKDFYDFEQYYDSRNVDYEGPKFGYAPMPDQYTLEDFRRRELAPADRPPVMAEIDLISSHHPWTPLPHMVPWDQVGDGSVYDGMPEQGESSKEVFRDPEAVKRVYGESVEYSWQALTSFLTTYNDPNLVLVVLGDHQPHTYVSGEHAGHDVPISVIAQDPAVMERIAGWGWQDGLRPSPDATVWRMDTFRDRFLDAFSAAGWLTRRRVRAGSDLAAAAREDGGSGGGADLDVGDVVERRRRWPPRAASSCRAPPSTRPPARCGRRRCARTSCTSTTTGRGRRRSPGRSCTRGRGGCPSRPG